MTARSVGKFLPALKLRLGTKAVISAILLIAVNTALVVGAAHWSLTNEFGDRALRDIEVNLRTLGLAFAETYSDAKITMKDGAVARAEIPKMPEFKDHAIVDRAVGYTGGNATLFVYDDASNQFVRRTTNVKKENGDRAVGTHLAPDHPGQAVVRRGEAYEGPATLFGLSCAAPSVLLYARDRPERVESIVFFGSFVSRHDLPEQTQTSLVLRNAVLT